MARGKIPLFDLNLSAYTIRRVNRVLRSGWLATGPVAEELEHKIEKRLGVPHAAAVSSASIGLEMALRALAVGSGDEVITTPFTFVATVEAILRVGARVVLADIDAHTLNLSPDATARRITKKTRLILPVDIAGRPVDYRGLRRLCRRHKLTLLADSSHALTALYRDKPTAHWADAAVYSLQATKNLTSAEGGIVASRQGSIIKQIRLMSRHGMTQDAFLRRSAGIKQYDITALGMKGNLPDVLAAIGVGELDSLAEFQRRRQSIASRYRSRLSNLVDLIALPSEGKGICHGWHLYIVQLQLSRLRLKRDDFIRCMAERDIECGVHYRPLFEFSHFRSGEYKWSDLPVAKKAGQQVVSLPIYPSLKISDVDYICQSVRQILLSHRR